MLIIFYQSKKCNQGSDGLPHHTVDIARKSLQTFQSLLVSAHQHAHFGIRYIPTQLDLRLSRPVLIKGMFFAM